ncbi:MAG TPA: AbrB/MazE/SpoVT family DNA-binding domain-containing protein [Nevskiaceae bacterium]|nr:AbrB/MazE/SpoVT family DNA-binding domain-containing protein [Nevskiaceae bacterium]
MSKQKIIKTGNSLAVTIPSEFVKAVGVKAGRQVQVTTQSETGQVIYTFSGTKQLLLSKNFIKKKRK